jgi:hypothetical protein
MVKQIIWDSRQDPSNFDRIIKKKAANIEMYRLNWITDPFQTRLISKPKSQSKQPFITTGQLRVKVFYSSCGDAPFRQFLSSFALKRSMQVVEIHLPSKNY